MNLFLDIIFPPRCVGCGRLGTYLCQNCQKRTVLRYQLCPECDKPAIDGATHPRCLRAYVLDGLTTAFLYEGVIKKAIKMLKYRLVSDLAETLVEILPQQIISHQFDSTPWVLYPVPLHQERLKWRGFNQAEELGKYLAKRLHTSLVSGLLVRKEKRTPQVDIDRRQDRIKNAQGLFIPTSKLKASKFPNILLFDDVWTTGATMKEATKVLKRGGVEKVWGFTITR